MLQLTTIRQDVPLPELVLARCEVGMIRWPGGSSAREASVVNRVAAGPGLEDLPIPDGPAPY